MRSVRFSLLVSVAALALLPVAPCRAQGLGIGGRFSFVTGDVKADTAAVRFTGGQIRAWLSGRTALELSLDRHTQTSDDLTERVRDSPLQVSLLLFPVRSTISPYVLGGVGWYTHRVEDMVDQKVVDSTSTRRRGTHAGFGAELRAGRHAALHADYRYTFLHFGSDDPVPEAASPADGPTESSSISRLLPSHEGSMWTAGLTIYF